MRLIGDDLTARETGNEWNELVTVRAPAPGTPPPLRLKTVGVCTRQPYLPLGTGSKKTTDSQSSSYFSPRYLHVTVHPRNSITPNNNTHPPLPILLRENYSSHHHPHRHHHQHHLISIHLQAQYIPPPCLCPRLISLLIRNYLAVPSLTEKISYGTCLPFASFSVYHLPARILIRRHHTTRAWFESQSIMAALRRARCGLQQTPRPRAPPRLFKPDTAAPPTHLRLPVHVTRQNPPNTTFSLFFFNTYSRRKRWNRYR